MNTSNRSAHATASGHPSAAKPDRPLLPPEHRQVRLPSHSWPGPHGQGGAGRFDAAQSTHQRHREMRELLPGQEVSETAYGHRGAEADRSVSGECRAHQRQQTLDIAINDRSSMVSKSGRWRCTSSVVCRMVAVAAISPRCRMTHSAFSRNCRVCRGLKSSGWAHSGGHPDCRRRTCGRRHQERRPSARRASR